MVKAWYMDDDSASDQRLEHHRNPPEYISIEELYKKTGVEYFKLNVDTYATDGVLQALKEKRGYTYEDEIVCSKECLPNYEEKIKSFYTEHLHTDEEIRFVVEGSGYFDVRDDAERWIRIAVYPGDMIVIPSGIYHRFTLDTNNYIRAKRFFIGEPVWKPYDRPADDMDCRKQYIEKQRRGFLVTAS
ncbi:acireductone dioxygenase [Galleria mellonella]|uniref:Acireductone dioxygenase n=1 Tax=Galleria mellonella TaxID=7137 RepID=A0ABM3MG01_GALME|nr:acireductone dioxygenase [Galleria mellonella]